MDQAEEECWRCCGRDVDKGWTRKWMSIVVGEERCGSGGRSRTPFVLQYYGGSRRKAVEDVESVDGAHGGELYVVWAVGSSQVGMLVW